MTAVLALLSTLVAAKLQLIQQWWLPTPPLLQQWWLPIVNGWCCPFAAHAMATTQQSPPLPFMWGNYPLASSAQACILHLFQAYHSESIFNTTFPFERLNHARSGMIFQALHQGL
jgi:hypothetical protein